MNAKIDKALEMATKAHKGQVDKAGNDYISHPIYVADHCRSVNEKIVALLHDTLEDTKLSVDEIKNNFGHTVSDAVLALTKRPDESYEEYLTRVKANPIARAVKIEDLKHNLDLSRLGHEPTDEDIERIAKYERALAFLGAV